MTHDERVRAWRLLSQTTRNAIVRGLREWSRCDGDWHGKDDLTAAGKLACDLLRDLEDNRKDSR